MSEFDYRNLPGGWSPPKWWPLVRRCLMLYGAANLTIKLIAAIAVMVSP